MASTVISKTLLEGLIKGEVELEVYLDRLRDGTIQAPPIPLVNQLGKDLAFSSDKKESRKIAGKITQNLTIGSKPNPERIDTNLSPDEQVLLEVKFIRDVQEREAAAALEDLNTEVENLTAAEIVAVTESGGTLEEAAQAKIDSREAPVPESIGVSTTPGESAVAGVSDTVAPNSNEGVGVTAAPSPVTAFKINDPDLGTITAFLDSGNNFLQAITETGQAVEAAKLAELQQRLDQEGARFEMERLSDDIQNIINVGDFFGRQEDRQLRATQLENDRLANLAQLDISRAELIAQAGPLGARVAEALNQGAGGGRASVSTRGLDIDAESLELFGITGDEFSLGDDFERQVGTPLGEPLDTNEGITETIQGLDLKSGALSGRLLSGIEERGGGLDLAALANIVGLSPENLKTTAGRQDAERRAPSGNRVFGITGGN